jgi:hypothetical protein
MEYSAKAHEYSQEAHRESGISSGETGNAASAEPVKRAKIDAKRSKPNK